MAHVMTDIKIFVKCNLAKSSLHRHEKHVHFMCVLFFCTTFTGIDSLLGKKEIFLFFKASRLTLDSTQSSIVWVLGAFSPYTSSVKLKNAWIHTSTSPYAFTVWSLIKHEKKEQKNKTHWIFKSKVLHERYLWNNLNYQPSVFQVSGVSNIFLHLKSAVTDPVKIKHCKIDR